MQTPIRQLIDESPMTRFQIVAATMCIVLNMLDGFDVLAVAFTAAHISKDWGLNGKQIGLLLSAGLVGMALGSLLLAPFADRIGRRKLVVICLTIISLGMFASAWAPSITALASCRVLTGVGIGGMLASLNVVAAEYCSNRSRSALISMQSAGYAFGATVGGTIAGALLMHFGWRSVFVFGGVVTAAALPLTLLWLPESLQFLETLRTGRALGQINHALRKMGHAPFAVLPARDPNMVMNEGGSPVSVLFSRELIARTCAIWVSFFLVMSAFYFVMSWTPKLLVQAGMSASQGITGGVLLNIGGMIGCTLFSFASTRMRLKVVLGAYLLVSAVLVTVFGSATSSLGMTLVLAVVLGAAISGCVGGLYALAPLLYPSSARTTGVGWAIGMGRSGAILSPLFVGALLDASWAVSSIYLLFAVPLLIAVASTTVIHRGLARPSPTSASVAAV